MSDPALDQTVNFYTHLRHGDIQIMAIWYLSISISEIKRSIDGFFDAILQQINRFYNKHPTMLRRFWLHGTGFSSRME